MDLEILTRLLGIGLLLMLSAFFSGAEAAVFTLGRLRLSRLAEELPAKARVIQSLIETPRRLIITILVGNVSVNVMVAVLWTSLFSIVCNESRPQWLSGLEWCKGDAMVALLGILTALLAILVLGEVIPRTIAVRFPRQFTALIVAPLFYFSWSIYPIRRLSDALVALLGLKPETAWDGMSDAGLLDLVEMGKEHGELDPVERKLLYNIFEFRDITVAELLTPRQEIFSLPAKMEPQQIISEVRKKRFSRVPIHQGDRDHIIGVLHVKDLLRVKAQGPGSVNIKSLIREPFVIAPSQSVNELLGRFQSGKAHLALVKDEFGGLIGLVTMEDLLEEIFGKIRDRDQPKLVPEKLGADHWLVPGRMEIDDFNEAFAASLEIEGIRTVGGLLVHYLGRVPKVGDTVVTMGFSFEVRELSRVRIIQVVVKRLAQQEPDQ